MRIKEKIVDDVAVLQISGKLMGGPETQEIHEHIKGLIADNPELAEELEAKIVAFIKEA